MLANLRRAVSSYFSQSTSVAPFKVRSPFKTTSPIFHRRCYSSTIMVQHTGACACEGVKYTVEQESLKSVAVCHCLTCQAWSGGISLYFEAAGPNVKVTEGEDNLKAWKSSEYCERVFCNKCGSSLYCRMTMPGSPMDNVHFFAAGTLKNWDGIDKIESEMFIDRKPALYNLEGTKDRKTMTAAEFYEMVSKNDCPSHEEKNGEIKEEK